MTQIKPQEPPRQREEPIRDDEWRREVARRFCKACGYKARNDEGYCTQAAHISAENYARGMKAGDDLLISLCGPRMLSNGNGFRGCHGDFDENQEQFAFVRWQMTLDELKAEARAAYQEWLQGA